MKKYLFLLTCFGLLLAQCQKDDTYLGDHTIAEGIITEEGTGKPVANVRMRLYKCTYQVFGSSSCATFDSTRTDAKGFFSFDFKHEKDYQYEIDAVPDAEKYFVRNNGAPVEKGRYSNKINLKLTPYAVLKLIVKNTNTNPDANADKFFTSVPTGRYIPELYGLVDTVFIGKTAGGQAQTIYWWVERKGVKTNFSEKVFCPAHDIVTYNINY